MNRKHTGMEHSPVCRYAYTRTHEHTHSPSHTLNTLNPLPERRSQVRPQVSEVPPPLTPGLLHQQPHCWSPQTPPWSSNQPSPQPHHIPPPSFLSSLKTKNFFKRSLLREKEKNIEKKKNQKTCKLLNRGVDRASFLS